MQQKFSSRFSPLSDSSSPERTLVELYRQISVLRANGQPDEADKIMAGKFAEALATLERGASPEVVATMAAQLQVLFSAEDERVANAQVLAALLAPLLGEKLRLAGMIASEPIPFESAPREKMGVSARSHSSVVPAAPPSVADFIEGMLNQDRLEAPRRAS